MCLRKKTTKFLLSLCLIGLAVLNVSAKTDTSKIIKAAEKVKTVDTVPHFPPNYVPQLHVDVIKDRLACLNTQINLTYSKEIMRWVKFYLIKNRITTRQLLEKSTFYFPIFEEALKRHNMPVELKYLPIVESALRPRAVSWAAAAGLWQFIPSTGREYGLKQDWYIDERYDIYKATDAACRYLKFLYNYHGDWQLALAAYNCGPGRVDWAVKKAGGKNNFWKIYKYLPRETRGYVPAFIGVTYVMNYANKHNIYAKRPVPPIPSDTIMVSNFVNLQQFAKQIDVPLGVMQILNAHLKKNAIPNYKRNYPLRYPAYKREMVEKFRGRIVASSRGYSRRGLGYTGGRNQYGGTKRYHRVKRGESLALIALRYRTTVAYLRVWNRLRSNLVYPNQRLVIYSKPPRRRSSKLGQNFVAAVHEMTAKESKKKKALAKKEVSKSVDAQTLPVAVKKTTTTTPKKEVKVVAAKPVAKKVEKQVTKKPEKKEPLTAATTFYANKVKFNQGEYQQLVAQTPKDIRNAANAKERKTSIGKTLPRRKTTNKKRRMVQNIRFHRVVRGDTLWTIARRNGLTIYQLKKLNGLSNRSVLVPGQRLKVSSR
jgi:membrane-bound lytic murein transglycosylase D